MKIRISFYVSLFSCILVMLRTIQFNNYLSIRDIKINNIRTNDFLSMNHNR